MAGSGAPSGFNAAEFREAITFAMTMGTPNNPSERATFRWSASSQFEKQDSVNRPYNWTAPALVVAQKPDVQVPVAVKFSGSGSGTSNNVGGFDSARAILTLLDEDFIKVAGANMVLLGENVYEVRYVEPPVGLFEVTVYKIHVEALNEA